MSERDAYNQKKAELLARSPVLLVFLSHHDVPDVTLASRFESLEIGFQQRQHLRRNSDAAENSVSSAVSEVSNILVLGGLVDNDLRENDPRVFAAVDRMSSILLCIGNEMEELDDLRFISTEVLAALDMYDTEHNGLLFSPELRQKFNDPVMQAYLAASVVPISLSVGFQLRELAGGSKKRKPRKEGQLLLPPAPKTDIPPIYFDSLGGMNLDPDRED